MKKIVALVLVLLLAVCSFAACGKTEAPAPAPGNDGGSADAAAIVDPAGQTVTPGGTLITGQGAEPITLNPDGKSDDSMALYPAQLMFNRLCKVTNMNNVVMDLAESYEMSADGKSYTFKLREGVKFHDGEVLTSEDVKFTFEEIVKQGCFAADSLAIIDSIECPDDLTVVFNLKEPNAGFLGTIGYNGTYILPKHVYEGKDWMGDDSMMTPVGTGPFTYEEWKSGVSLSFVKNPDYFLGPDVPYLDRVVISYIPDADTATQNFKNGELDLLGVMASDTTIQELMADSSYNSYPTIYASRFYLGFNHDIEMFNDVNFRKAVAHAINIDDIMARALKTSGQKPEAYFSPLFDWANNKDESAKIPEFNLDKAKEYMAATGLTPDADGFVAHIKLDTYNYAPFPDLSQVIKAQLAEVGIDVEINMLEYAAWDEKVDVERDFECALTGGYVGPDIRGVENRIMTGGIFNFMGYSNPELDELMVKGAEGLSEEERAPYYKEVCQILADEQPMIMIGEWVAYTPVPQYVHNEPHDTAITSLVGTADLQYTWME